MSYAGHSFGWMCFIPLLRCSQCIIQPQPTGHESEKVSISDTKQSEGEVSVILELWGMRNTPSLPLLLGPLWLGMVAPDMVLSMG